MLARTFTMSINDSGTVRRLVGHDEASTHMHMFALPAIPDLLHNTGDVFILASLLTHCIITKDVYFQTVIRMPVWIFLTIVCSHNLRFRDDRCAVLQEIFRLGIILYYGLKLNFKLDFIEIISANLNRKRRKVSLEKRKSSGIWNNNNGIPQRLAKVATISPAKRDVLSAEEVQRFYKGVPTLIKRNESIAYHAMAYDKNLEISYSNFTTTDGVPHEGYFRKNYGVTFPGMLTHSDKKYRVCIKSNLRGDLEGLRGLMREVKMLKYVGHHDNLQSLFGACTKDISNGQIYLVLENCGNRTLNMHLKDLKNAASNMLTCHSTIPEDLLIDFYRWAYEISSGMKFISSKDIIHGMLTCDCILINEVGTVKLTDFGTAPYLLEPEKFTPEEWNHDSWRYLAPEALIDNKFTTSGDIWSFGVVLWKTFAISSVPFPSFKRYNRIFPLSLLDGMRPDQDEKIPPFIFELIAKCWVVDFEKRPSFDMCCQYLYLKTKPKRRIVTCDGDFMT